jgi:RHS repeat-associated protein
VGVTKNNASIATFVYDGDGTRVKSTINGVTTSFVGQHYEVTNSVATKYYFAGTSRIAMRTGSTLTYLLTDHLNSTSITTNSSGGLVSELRYKPWGETRFSSGTTSTKYQYTGQYSYQSDFGLMFYNARWYDSTTGRFAQADSIVPAGVQGYDRYAYVNNSPLRYTDPTGHWETCNDGSNRCRIYARRQARQAQWGVSDKDLQELMDAVKAGGLVAYNLFGNVQYAMYTSAKTWWDMTLKQTISIRDIQHYIMGLFEYQPKVSNFKLNSYFGHVSETKNEIGDTLEFSDFPVGWGNGNDSHVGFYSQSKIDCGTGCSIVGYVSGVTLLHELGILAFESVASSSSASMAGPYAWAAVATTVFIADLALNIVPSEPLVLIYPGPAQIFAPIPTIGLPPIQ